MKRLLFFAIILGSIQVTFAQNPEELYVNGTPFQEIQGPIIEVRIPFRMFQDGEFQVRVEYGQPCTYGIQLGSSVKCNALCDAEGEPVFFPSQVLALNFFAQNGWALVGTANTDEQITTFFFTRQEPIKPNPEIN